MNYRITDLLDGLEEAGQPVTPQGGEAARVKAKTLARLHAEEAPARSVQPVRRRFRPAAILAAALAAVLLLSGTVFAAWKSGAFRFATLFGPEGEILDSHAQTYEPEDGSQAIPADYGYASWVTAQAGDYNLTLVSLTASEGQLHATVDLSSREEAIPAYRDSGLTLTFADYKTVSASRELTGWKDRVELYAAYDGDLAADAEIRLSLSGSGATPALASFTLDAIENARQAMAASNRQHFATVAETKDFRFSLRSLTASPSSIYAVIDVEALTDWGAAHLDRAPEFSVYNCTHQASGSLLDARLTATDDGVRSYLIGSVGSLPCNEAGDAITFELLELFEEGDVSGHPYYLFDVTLESVLSGGVALTEPQGEPIDIITWQSLSVDAMGLTVIGSLGGTLEERGQELDKAQHPVVTLVFRDGTRETVMEEDWRIKDRPETTHEAICSNLGGEYDGTVYQSLVFAQAIDPNDLAAIIVDGQTFSLE